MSKQAACAKRLYMYTYIYMHNGPTHFKNLAAFAKGQFEKGQAW